jgi:hypothetical protein
VRKRYGNIATGRHLLVDTAKEKMMKEELRNDPYANEMIEAAYADHQKA